MSCSSSLSVTSGSFVCTFEARKAHWAANEWSSCSVPYASLFHAARLLTCSLFGSGACAKREDNRRTMGGQITDTGKAPAEYMYMCKYMYCLNLRQFQVIVYLYCTMMLLLYSCSPRIKQLASIYLHPCVYKKSHNPQSEASRMHPCTSTAMNLLRTTACQLLI